MTGVVSCDARASPLPVEQFVRDGSGAWRQLGDASYALVAWSRVELRYAQCRRTVSLRGRRLAALLDRGQPLTLGLLAGPDRPRLMITFS